MRKFHRLFLGYETLFCRFYLQAFLNICSIGFVNQVTSGLMIAYLIEITVADKIDCYPGLMTSPFLPIVVIKTTMILENK